MRSRGYTSLTEKKQKTESLGAWVRYFHDTFHGNDSKILDKRKIREKLVQKQTEQHEKRHLFRLVKKGNVVALEKHLKDKYIAKDIMEGKIDKKRDCVGANIIHIAYLVKNYEIGRWLVKSFPALAIKPYKAKFSKKVHEGLGINEENSNTAFPYEGENILHIVIVQKNYEEAKWLLDFYCTLDPKHLKELLLGKTTGHFFTDRKDSFYCGCFPLHFAACSNDTQLFDLFLAYNSSLDCIKDEDDHHAHEKSPKGFDVVFMCDQDGNNCLHLVVIHKLKKMYDHILRTVTAWLLCDLKRNVYKPLPPPAWEDGFGCGYTLQVEESRNSQENNSVNNEENNSVNNEENNSEKNEEENTSEDSTSEDSDSEETYVEKSRLLKQKANRILCQRFTLALNNDFLSPLTLCAAGLYADIGNGDEMSSSEQESRRDMLQFLINKMRSEQWIYGRNTRILI